MKALLPLLSSLLLLTSCSPPKEIDYGKLKYSNDFYLDPDTGKGFTGIAHQKYPDGKPQGTFPFKDGRLHGTVQEWYANGKMKSETEFKDGERSGKNTECTEAGAIYNERIYDHDHIVSEKNYDAAK